MTAVSGRHAKDVKATPAAKESQAAKESMLVARSQVGDLSQDLEADSHRVLAQLEEHIATMGGRCPREILDSREAVLASVRNTRTALEDVQDGLSRLYHRE